MTRTVTFIHGLIGDDVGLLARDAWDALEQADGVIYPGEWIATELVTRLGSRLHKGRHLTLSDLMQRASACSSPVVLFNGDGAICSGVAGRFPSATQLREIFVSEGYQVRDIAGTSSVFLALQAAGWELPALPEAQLTIASPLCERTGGLDELRLLAACPSLLALLWWEDRAAETLALLQQIRGSETAAALVRNLGTAEAETHVGTLASIAAHLPIAPPAVLLVQPSAELPGQLLDAARAWAAACPPGITWLLGPPGAGKSTWLRALQAVGADLHTAELGAITSPLLSPARYLRGGLQALGHAAQMIRALAANNPEQRFVIAGTSLPDWALQSSADAAHSERLVLLHSAERSERQRLERPTPNKATATQTAYCLENLSALQATHLHELLEVPYLPQLLGRHSS